MKRLLIANRGEIARRIIRTARKCGLETVAIYSDPDAGALHVREATTAVAIGGRESAESYLKIDAVMAAAQASGADSIHPGYGFLSENADFAQAVHDAGLIWVGPPAEAVRTLGNKSRARRLAQAHGIPCLPGYEGDDQSDERFLAEARRIGLPLMVKAAAGGGGRGMRLVTEASRLTEALKSARSEAKASFGSDQVLIERALLRPRHVEIQILADAHGRCLHLGERDCSVQRRHQKIVEETPSPRVGDALRRLMGAAAVDLALAAGYVGAGTVEFLLDDQSPDEFFLMEMNTRLQVEHPVTEMVTGLDLVEWQLRIAAGEALPFTQDEVKCQGHAIEVRLCAEDDDFKPHSGRVERFDAPHADGDGLRFDHALESGVDISRYYDSMLGKLIAHGADRHQAIERLIAGLAGTRILGLANNRKLLKAVLAHPDFRSGQALIPFLAENALALAVVLKAREKAVLVPAILGIVHRDGAASTRLASPFARSLRLVWRDERLAVTILQDAEGGFDIAIDGQTHRAALGGRSAGGVAVLVDGVQHVVHAIRNADGRWHVQVGGVDLWLDDISFVPSRQGAASAQATEVRAPLNGIVLRIEAQPGQTVGRGDPLIVIESMKLEHTTTAPRDAVVKTILVEAGQQVATGYVLLNFEPADQPPV